MPSKKRKTIAEANVGKSTRKRKQHMQGLADKKERRLRKVVRQLAKLSSILLQPMDWHGDGFQRLSLRESSSAVDHCKFTFIQTLHKPIDYRNKFHCIFLYCTDVFWMANLYSRFSHFGVYWLWWCWEEHDISAKPEAITINKHCLWRELNALGFYLRIFYSMA